jgi:adenosylcobinamide kinase/adenosylcobinamide-phosphate guanylyltransferase
VGWSLVPETPSGRFFADELGRLNAAVSAVADRVHLVVAGRVLDLTAAPLVPELPRSRTLDA